MRLTDNKTLRLTDDKAILYPLNRHETPAETIKAFLKTKEIKYVKNALYISVGLTAITLVGLATVSKEDTHMLGSLTFLLMGTTITVAATSLKLFESSKFFNK